MIFKKKINKENVQKLVDALRSGKYQQGQGQLKDENTYCCLGVACDIFRKETGKGEWNTDEFIFSTEHYVVYLPHVVKEYFGFGFQDPYVKLSDEVKSKFNSGETTLSSINDEGSISFEQIADIIEDNFLEVDQ